MKLPITDPRLIRLAAVAGYAIALLPIFGNYPLLKTLLGAELQDIGIFLHWLLTLATGLGFMAFLQRKTDATLWTAFIHLVLATASTILLAEQMLEGTPYELSAFVMLLCPPLFAVILPATIASHLAFDLQIVSPSPAHFSKAVFFTFVATAVLLGAISGCLGINYLLGSQNEFFIFIILLLITATGIASIFCSERWFNLSPSANIVSFAVATTLTCILLCSYWGPDEHGKTGLIVMNFLYAPYLFVFLLAALWRVAWKRRRQKSSPPFQGQAAVGST